MNMPRRPEVKSEPRALTTQEQRNRIIGMVRSGQADIQDDGNGQLVIYTGLFRWSDQTVREEPEPVKVEDDRVL